MPEGSFYASCLSENARRAPEEPRWSESATECPGDTRPARSPRATYSAEQGRSLPGFVNHGGPVVATPLVYASFWGSQWTADAAHLTRAAHLTQFLTDMVASQYMNC
jgi:hypothetical protein